MKLKSARLPGLLAIMTAVALATACGGSDEPRDAGETDGSKPAKARAAVPDGDEGLANAVIVGTTSAPVNLKYDLPVKPEAGQPFEIALTFLTRQPADQLEVTMSGMQGLTVVGGAETRFGPVEAGGRYQTKVLAQADASGLYYIGVVAKVVTKIQTETRTFSIPLVVGDPPAAAKAAPATDATGEPIESMPATEDGEAGQ